MSPILFNIFINNLAVELQDSGVEVNGVDGRIGGLLFADDLAILAPSEDELEWALKALEAWTEHWVMSVGHAKCGIMVVGGDKEGLCSREWKISGLDILVVQSYKYLGTPFTPDLKLSEHLRTREEGTQHIEAKLWPFLASHPDVHVGQSH